MKNEELRDRIEKMLKMLDKQVEAAKLKVEKLCESTGCFEKVYKNDKKPTHQVSDNEPSS